MLAPTIERIPTYKLGAVMASLLAEGIEFHAHPDPGCETWTIIIVVEVGG